MIRINLIPPEILQNRVDERRWKWMALFGVVVSAVLVLFWAFMALQVTASMAEVDSVAQEAAGLEAQAAQFQVFDRVEADLKIRKAAVAAATAGEVDWERMLFEIGMVLPKDIYLTSFTGADAGVGNSSSISLAGNALDRYNDSPENGYKSVAKMLVRLAYLEQLNSVWLSNTAGGSGAAADAEVMPMINWSVSAKITPDTAPAP